MLSDRHADRPRESWQRWPRPGLSVVERRWRWAGMEPQAPALPGTRRRSDPPAHASRFAGGALRRAALPHQLLVPRRCVASRATGGGSRSPRPRGACGHRSRRSLRCRSFRRGSARRRVADGVRRRDHAGRSHHPSGDDRRRHATADRHRSRARSSCSRSAWRSSARAGRWAHRVRPPCPCLEPRPSGGREERAEVHAARHRRCDERSRLGAHRVPQGSRAGGAGRAWACGSREANCSD